MQILSCVWGEKHIELFRRTCLRSLAFPENRKSIFAEKTKWNICTEKKYFDYLRREIDIHFPELEVSFKSTEQLRNYIDPIQSAIISQIEDCLKSEDALIIAPPDTIFGDKTIPNLIKAGRDKDACVVVPHPRVTPDILEKSFEPYLTNAELVRLAWGHLHQSWTDAEVGHVRQNSFVGGVKWERFDGGMIAVTHRLPTPYYVKFTPEDLDYFKSQISFGGFDHTWPGDILIKRERQRFVASSDACFIVEVTEKDKNVPPIWPGDVNSFWRSHYHNQINKGIISTFRMDQ